jgi:hypothetical protein
VYNPLADLVRRFIALGISSRPEVAERRTENDQWIRTRGMRLGRYFIGALVLAILAIIFERDLFENKPALAAALSGAYVVLVVYGGLLRYRQHS